MLQHRVLDSKSLSTPVQNLVQRQCCQPVSDYCGVVVCWCQPCREAKQQQCGDVVALVQQKATSTGFAAAQRSLLFLRGMSVEH